MLDHLRYFQAVARCGSLSAAARVLQVSQPGLTAIIKQLVESFGTRLLVRPVYPYRHTHSVYPVPYRFEYPGPNAKRECVARYVEEHRPSGTVVTPRLRCWWVRG